MPRVSEKYLESRKNKIAKSAINVFAKKGYTNTSMKDIMKEANVSRGGLYAYFENIDAVFIAALKYDDAVQAQGLLRTDVRENFFTQLNDWIYEMVASITEEETNLVRAKSEFFLSHNIEEVPYLRQRHQKLSQNIQQFIQLGIKSGEFKEQIDLNAFSELLISMIDGLMLHRYYQSTSDADSSAILQQMNEMLQNSLT